MRRFRTLRGRLTAVAVVAAFLAITALTVVFNVVLDRSLDADARTRLRSQAAAAATTVVFVHGKLQVRESPDDAAVDRQVWIYQGTHAIERAVADSILQRAADALAGQSNVFDDVLSHNVRMYAAPITDEGRRAGTVVVGESLVAYDRTTDLALIGSLGLAGVLLAAVLVLTRLTIARALDPVRDMTRSVAAWSEQDLDRRFGTAAHPDELGELAETFNDLLDRVSASLRHEQRLSAELSHELRTPLARIVAAIELLQRRERTPEDRSEAYASIERSAVQMGAILETLMAAARADAKLDQGRSDVRWALDELSEHWKPILDRRDITLQIQPLDQPLMAGVDREVVERVVTPLLDNAARYARSRIDVAARREGGWVVLTVADDGPGLPAEARDHVFEPGGRNGADDHPGAGLGLSLARRLARAAGGDVTAAAPLGAVGAEFRVELPA